MLVSKGLTTTLLDLFPNVEWVPENIGAFTIILERAVKLFKKIQLESQVKPEYSHCRCDMITL